ncbi:MAG: gliding motility-associated C-terminal domain-containing protein [Ferruginibacter sp.]|nr:gliding motility-associated C-terminal domain-containing protein [Cytophagales bacterium]
MNDPSHSVLPVLIRSCFFLLFSFHSGFAQTPVECDPGSSGTATGCFTVNTPTQSDVTRVCVGTPIDVVKCAPSKGNVINLVNYDYDDDGPLPITSATAHTYTRPGTYTLVQKGTGDSTTGITCISLRKQIVVLPTPVPVARLTACSGPSVLLTIPKDDPDNAYQEYAVDWGDGTPPVLTSATTLQHVYSSPGGKTVTITGRYNPGGCGSSGTVSVTVGAALNEPQLRQLEVKDAASVALQFTPTTDFPTYEVQQRKLPSGDYQAIQTLLNPSGPQTVLITGINTTADAYCYRVLASDACGKPFDLGEICTVGLQVTAQNGQNRLQWPVYGSADFQGYDLYRNDQLIRTIANAPTNQFTDVDVQCARQYCYRLVARTARVQSLSRTECVTAVSDEIPTAVEDLSASVENNRTVLTWKQPERFAALRHIVLRSRNGGAFEVRAQLAGPASQFTEPPSNVDSSRYCYRVAYVDSCGKASDSSGVVCPMRLKAIASAAAYELAWSAYSGWRNGVRTYFVEWLDAEGNVWRTDNAGLALAYAEEELDTVRPVIFFRIRAVSDDAVPLVSLSNVVELRQALRVFLPDAFTPNEDGLNETYAAKGLFIRRFRMQIFNRWGELLFTGDSRDEGWNGKANGRPAPPGNYVCKLEVEDYAGNPFRKTKTFVLLR